MLYVRTSPTANQTLNTCNVAVGIGSGLNATTSGVVNIRLVYVNQVPVRCTYVATLVLQGALTQYYTDRVLAKLFVVSQRVLNLPLCSVGLLG